MHSSSEVTVMQTINVPPDSWRHLVLGAQLLRGFLTSQAILVTYAKEVAFETTVKVLGKPMLDFDIAVCHSS